MEELEMIEVICNDRLGRKVRIKCSDQDTIGDLKLLIAAHTGTRPEKIRLQKSYVVYKDHITLADYEIGDGSGIEISMNYGGFKSIGAENWKNRDKKKKHLCPICRIEVANHPSSISIHEKSEKHIQLRNELLDNGGRRSKESILPAFRKYPDQDVDNTVDENGKPKSIKQQLASLMDQNRVDNLGYNKPVSDDNTFSIQQIKNDPVWSSHIDSSNNKIYYFNRLTKKSEWKKPKDFDGVDLKSRADNEYTRTFRTFEATPLEQPKPTGEGRIGKWETVQPENDYFKVNAVKNEEENKESQAKPRQTIKTTDNIPEGEIIGEMHSDEEKYEYGDNVKEQGNSESPQQIEKKREIKNDLKKQVANKEDKLMINQKDQFIIFRNKIDQGKVDEEYRKETFKEKSELSKVVGNVPTTFKKRSHNNKNKRRKIADEDDDDDDY